MFTLKGVVDEQSPIDLEDSHNVKTALTVLGHYDDTDTGLSPYPERKLFHAIRDFQKSKGLKIDGIIKPNGPTHTRIKQEISQDTSKISAYSIFKKNRDKMIVADTIGADKYFHCLANYEATEKGWGGKAAFWSGVKELLLFPKEAVRGGFISSLIDSNRDHEANRYGRNAAKSGKFTNAKKACQIYRPKGLDEKY